MSKDTIYRQDAIDIADDLRACINVNGYWAWMERLKALPSAEFDTEEWIGGELGHTSKCGHEGCSSDIWDGCKNFYCPNCGRKVIWR